MRLRRDCKPAPRQEWGTAYGATWLTIEETNEIVGRLNEPVFDLDREEAEILFLMLFNSLSDVIAAVYTVTCGWVRPSKTKVRGALETIATAVTIHHDAVKMQRSMSKGSRRMSWGLHRRLPEIGRLYGKLSNQWAHETFDSTARSINQEARQLLLVPFPTTGSTPLYINAFLEIALVAQMVGITLKTCFPKLAGPEIHFQITADGSRTRVQTRSTDAIREIVKARKGARRT